MHQIYFTQIAYVASARLQAQYHFLPLQTAQRTSAFWPSLPPGPIPVRCFDLIVLVS
jgi:hypothetical protein